MHRFTLAAGLALLCIPADAARKPKPPDISVCYGNICLAGLHWVRPDTFGSSVPSISGVLINNSESTLSLVSDSFSLMSGQVLRGTASDTFSGQIPPGARWVFNASFVEFDGHTFVTRVDSGRLAGVRITTDGSRRFSQPFTIDPVFNPSDRAERKEWEKLHGKRSK